MPIIAAFLGMLIRVFHSDHPPPHIHVEYGEFGAIVEIQTGRILKGKLPPRVLRLLREWLKGKRKEILAAWKEAQEHKIPRKIKAIE